MTFKTFIIAFGIVMILEGLYPALMPKQYQNFLKELLKVKPTTLRKIGTSLIVIGLVILFFMN